MNAAELEFSELTKPEYVYVYVGAAEPYPTDLLSAVTVNVALLKVNVTEALVTDLYVELPDIVAVIKQVPDVEAVRVAVAEASESKQSWAVPPGTTS